MKLAFKHYRTNAACYRQGNYCLAIAWCVAINAKTAGLVPHIMIGLLNAALA